jgi:hypothetical protein
MNGWAVSSDCAHRSHRAAAQVVVIRHAGPPGGRRGSCGPQMISGEYSRLLVEVNAQSATTIFGRIALNAAITGLCRVDGTTIVLDQQARLVCAGRQG